MTHQRGANAHRHQVLIEPSAHRANGKDSRIFHRPAWSVAEFALVAALVPPVPLMAARFAFAGDRSCYWQLWGVLTDAAQELRVRRSWPAQVRGRSGRPQFYIEPLSQLVLDEDANGHAFTSVPALYWIRLSITEATWNNAVSGRFDALKLRYQGWLNEAISLIQPRLEELEAG